MSRPRPAIRLDLLGGFRLVSGGADLRVRPAGQRLLALVALKSGLTRETAAWTLWMDHPEEYALACLRSGLWRLPKPHGRALVVAADGRLTIAPEVSVDIDETSLDDELTPEAALSRLTSDLLPGWYDEWLVVERERRRQRRLHELEALAARLVDDRRYAEAIEVGLHAVDADLLRESAHRCVIRAHLAEGNAGEALRQAKAYARRLDDAGIPGDLSTEMVALLGPLSANVRRRAARPLALAR